MKMFDFLQLEGLREPKQLKQKLSTVIQERSQVKRSRSGHPQRNGSEVKVQNNNLGAEYAVKRTDAASKSMLL